MPADEPIEWGGYDYMVVNGVKPVELAKLADEPVVATPAKKSRGQNSGLRRDSSLVVWVADPQRSSGSLDTSFHLEDDYTLVAEVERRPHGHRGLAAESWPGKIRGRIPRE